MHRLANQLISLPRPLRLFCAVAVTLTLCSLAFTFGSMYLAHEPYPYGLPFFQGSASYWDFSIFAHRFSVFRQPGFWNTQDYPFTYPAATAVVFAFFYSLPGDPIAIYLTIVSIALAVFTVSFGIQLVRNGLRAQSAVPFILCLMATNWGVGYLMNRANIEGVVVFVVAVGILCFLRERYLAAALLFGLAAAMKIFPFIYLALLLSKRKYREAAAGLAAAVLINLGSLKLIGPSIRGANHNIALGLQYFQDNWAAAFMSTEIGYDHSLFSLFKFVFAGMLRLGLIHSLDRHVLLDRLTTWGRLHTALFAYTLAAALIGIVLWFARVRHMPVLNQILVLALCSVLLPPVSFDYTLVHLLLPFALLSIFAVRAAIEKRPVRGLVGVFVLFAFIFSMNAFFTFEVRLAGQFRALAMLILLVQVVRNPFALEAEPGHPVFQSQTMLAPGH